MVSPEKNLLWKPIISFLTVTGTVSFQHCYRNKVNCLLFQIEYGIRDGSVPQKHLVDSQDTFLQIHSMKTFSFLQYLLIIVYVIKSIISELIGRFSNIFRSNTSFNISFTSSITL